ncbi:Na+/H+ antiporter subunit G [Aquabacter spiritensis]|uniref:Multisubunit potassium/proton antiporter PhaG subunit n=1 Tax=Aquabacter spiritensis TaxID=933073 RepID=A0A4R3M1N2_9HYPH|nr:Na+/H+ antiporter subunit G [Aquabacter spiritensis]TCT05067.1 multisubunit potassium/proton antiporter PhaG subunit [Aquabacter spiritensis]
MPVFVEALVAGLILIGAFFLFVGALGLVRLPDLMRRLHGPTKATTLGIGALLIASMIYFASVHETFSIHELLITLFLFLTAPVSANMMAKAHILRAQGERGRLPPTGTSAGWATFDSGKREKG